tara:strand:- start:282 stop:494 length:213 start_codon:yes stop_codon:yes gene_type:complete
MFQEKWESVRSQGSKDESLYEGNWRPESFSSDSWSLLAILIAPMGIQSVETCCVDGGFLHFRKDVSRETE